MTVSNSWILLRVGRIKSIISQAKFIDNCLTNSEESAESIMQYINELKEMIDDLQKMNRE